VKAIQKMKIETLQNEKLKLYRYEIYKVCTYSQKQWLDLPSTWTKSPTMAPNTWWLFFNNHFPTSVLVRSSINKCRIHRDLASILVVWSLGFWLIEGVS